MGRAGSLDLPTSSLGSCRSLTNIGLHRPNPATTVSYGVVPSVSDFSRLRHSVSAKMVVQMALQTTRKLLRLRGEPPVHPINHLSRGMPELARDPERRPALFKPVHHVGMPQLVRIQILDSRFLEQPRPDVIAPVGKV